MIRILPTFKGYTVDVRLKEFRKSAPNHGLLEFIPFNSPKGARLLGRYIDTLNAETQEGRELLTKIWG